jgi:hypothetical protein
MVCSDLASGFMAKELASPGALRDLARGRGPRIP